MSAELLEDSSGQNTTTVIAKKKLGRNSRLDQLEAQYFTVNPSTPTKEVLGYFEHSPQTPGIIVCNGNHMLGVITRQAFFEHISTGYGRSLFLSRKIMLLLDAISEHEDCCQPAYESDMKIIDAAQKALARTGKAAFDPVVVRSSDGSYGILDIYTLLQAQGEILRRVNHEVDKMLGDACDYVTNRLPFPLAQAPIKVDWAYLPHESMSGDCFDYRWIDEDNFLIFLIDVSGHGIKPALLAVSILNLLALQKKKEEIDLTNPEAVLAALNRQFRMKDHDKLFFSIWYGVFNNKTRELTYATAGHPPAILYNHKNALSDNLNSNGVVIGTGMENLIYPARRVLLNPGAELYVFSDGVFEYTTRQGHKADFDEWDDLLRSSRAIGIKDSFQLIEQVKTMAENEELDDDCSLLHLTFV